MRHAQEKAHKEPTTSPQTHPAKMHHMTQPTVPSCEATALPGHPRSLILFTCQRSHTRLSGYLLSLSSDIDHAGSSMVTKGHYPLLCLPPGGGGRDRTDDLMLAKHALSQLSYAPTGKDQQNSGGPGKT